MAKHDWLWIVAMTSANSAWNSANDKLIAVHRPRCGLGAARRGAVASEYADGACKHYKCGLRGSVSRNMI